MAREQSPAAVYARAHDAAFRAELKVKRLAERKKATAREWEDKIADADREWQEARQSEARAKAAHEGESKPEAPKA